MNKLISLIVMSSVAGGLLCTIPGAQAKPADRSLDKVAEAVSGRSDYTAYRRYRRGSGSAAAGAAVAGVAGALIGGAIAAESRPDYGYYDAPTYGYGYGAVPAYGYAPASGYVYEDDYDDED